MTAGNFSSTASALGHFIPSACLLKQSRMQMHLRTLAKSACKFAHSNSLHTYLKYAVNLIMRVLGRASKVDFRGG